MAANLKSGGVIACFGKRFVNQIRTTSNNTRDTAQLSPLSASALSFRRAVHVSVYEKNPDDQAVPSLVPDHAILPQSDKYWAPHPQTGVFGPEVEHGPVPGGERGFHSSPDNNGGDSVLEEKAFFRHTSIEDLEKPH